MQTVLAFDPSLRNWGCVVAQVDMSTQTVNVLHTATLKIVSDADAKNIQLFEIAGKMFVELYRLIKQYKPDLIVSEIPHGSQSANGMKFYAFTITILGIISKLGIPLKVISAYDVKHVVSSDNPSKKNIVEWVHKKHPSVFPLNSSGKVTVDSNQHVADAIVVIYAHLNTLGVLP